MSPPSPQPGAERRARVRDDPERTAHHDAIFAFARACEIHDQDTGSHVLRIRLVVEAAALVLGLAERDAEDLGYDAMLHDVGKLHLPPSLLGKPDALTDEERRLMESHTLRGEAMLVDRPTMQRAARIARSHHESWDGSGYPDGLAADAIPLEARITAAADILDALVADRSYKPAWTYEAAIDEIKQLAGTRLDPDVVEAIRRCDEQGRLREIFGVDGS